MHQMHHMAGSSSCLNWKINLLFIPFLLILSHYYSSIDGQCRRAVVMKILDQLCTWYLVFCSKLCSQIMFIASKIKFNLSALCLEEEKKNNVDHVIYRNQKANILYLIRAASYSKLFSFIPADWFILYADGEDYGIWEWIICWKTAGQCYCVTL